MSGKPLNRLQAKKRIVEILSRHPDNLIISSHAFRRGGQREITTQDVVNVLKSPSAQIFDEPYLEGESWRYKVETRKIVIIVAFDEPKQVIVVTVIRRETQ